MHNFKLLPVAVLFIVGGDFLVFSTVDLEQKDFVGSCYEKVLSHSKSFFCMVSLCIFVIIVSRC